MMRMLSRGCLFGPLLAGFLLVVGCGSPQANRAPASGGSQISASIEANPNPVPAGSQPGTTTITWNTGDRSQSQVYVSQDGGDEKLFASGSEGSEDAPWIQTGSTYMFSLYAGSDHRTQLTSVKVSRLQ